MRPSSWSPTKALAVALGLAIALVPASSGLAAKKPAKHGTVKGCSLKKKAKCKKAKITKAKVGKVNLTGTNLQGATITGATFNGTDLTQVDMSGAKISNTTFRNVKVANLKMDGATLDNVTFTGATVGGARQSAREQECAAAAGDVLGEGADVFTCTGGGVSLRGAVLSRHIKFVNSVIPNSDFSRTTTSESARNKSALGTTILALVGTDAHGTNFQMGLVPVAVEQDLASGVGSNVSQSVFDNGWIWAISGSNASQASFLDAVWVYQSTSNLLASNVNTTGARGLDGARTVMLGVKAGLAGVGATSIREDGFWKLGKVCTTPGATCTTSVANGQPLVVRAWGTTPIQISAPGDWACERVAGTGDYPYLAQCTVPITVRGTQSAEVEPYVPPVTTHVVRAVVDPASTPPQVAALLQIDVVNSSGTVLSSTPCANAATCSATVNDGAIVRVSATSNSPQWLDVTCAPGDVLNGPFAPGTPFACPDATITADRTTTVMLS